MNESRQCTHQVLYQQMADAFDQAAQSLPPEAFEEFLQRVDEKRRTFGPPPSGEITVRVETALGVLLSQAQKEDICRYIQQQISRGRVF